MTTNNSLNNQCPNLPGNQDIMIVKRTAAGIPVKTIIRHQSDTAGSSAACVIAVGTSTQQPYMAASGIQTWSIGSTGNGVSPISYCYVAGALGISPGSATLSFTPTGEMNRILTPFFSAYRSATINDVTGNGTVYGPIVFDGELDDVAADYDNTTGVFTAPIGGIYFLEAGVCLTGITAATYCIATIVTTGNSFLGSDYRGISTLRLNAYPMVICQMATGDTAHVTIAAFGEVGDTDDVLGGQAETFFRGYLIG